MINRFRGRGVAVPVAVALLVTGCVSAEAARETRLELMMPPEYLACSDVPQQLAEADARLRLMRRGSASAETQFWVNRQERLIARAYTCQGG